MHDFTAFPHPPSHPPRPAGSTSRPAGPPFQAGPPFRVVYADPPWRLPGGVRLPYPTMGTRAVCALPVADVCAADCALLLGAVPGLLPDALAVVAAWGFTFRTVAFVWAKANRTRPGFFVGRGGWTRQNAEVCLLGTRGHPKWAGASVPGLVSPGGSTAASRTRCVSGSWSCWGTCRGRSCSRGRRRRAGRRGTTRWSATSPWPVPPLRRAPRPLPGHQ